MEIDSHEEQAAILSPIERAWDLFERFDHESGELDQLLEGISDELKSLSSHGLLSGAERAQRTSLEEKQSVIYAKLIALKEASCRLCEDIEKFEAGDIDEEALAGQLDSLDPADESEEEPIGALSKRKLAIRNANIELARRMGIDVDSWEFRFKFGKNGTRVVNDDPELRTDPRRIASGRSASRLIAKGALTSLDAESSFMNATADTHGGKTRRHGKNGKFYTGKSGRRIRKK